MKPHRAGDGERSLAVFIDFENMGLGFNNRRDKFEISKVLERLVEKGKIVAKKAYADWSRFGMYTGGLHEAAIELVEIPRRGVSGKNSADIRLVVDAIDLAYSKDHIDTFVIVSGDSDFSPLVSKLKELGKHVIGLGLVDATSDLLRDNCDEFIYYEDLDRAPIIPVAVNEQIPEKKRKVFALLLDSLLALRRENKDVIYSSMVKDTMKRKKPSFNEEYYGYRTFSEMLEDAQKDGLVEIEKHKGSGMYIVSRFGLEMKAGPSLPVNGGSPKSARVPLPEERKDRPPANGAREPGRDPAPPVREALPAGGRATPPDRPKGGRAAVPPVQAPATQPTPTPATESARGRPPAVEPTRARPPVLPVPPPRDEPEPDAPAQEDRPLGRALADEIDLFDDVDEVPSYSPRKAVPKPTPTPKTPAAPRSAGPAKASTPAKSTGSAKPAAAAKPAATEKPAGEAPKRTRTTAASSRTGGGGRRKPTETEAAPPPLAQTTPIGVPAARLIPTPKPIDDDDFGAGLDS